MKRVLVIEGDGYNRRYMGQVIERLGYLSLLRGDVESGLRLLRLDMQDAVICGDRLGENDSIQLCRTIKNDPKFRKLPVHIVSSQTDEFFRSAAIAAGAYSVMMWPLSIRSFFKNLEGSLFENRRRHLRSIMNFPVMVTPEYHTVRQAPQRLETHDFGVGGMYIKTPDPFPRGDPVNMRFSLPSSGSKVIMNGVVARTNIQRENNIPPGMGIMFQGINDDHRSLFSVFVERFLARGTF